MPSNKDLIATAGSLAKELGEEISTEGLNNQALATLVSDLKAKKAEAEAVAKAEPEIVIKKTDSVGITESKAFVIAKGKSVTSLKGILGEGETVTPEHFKGGQETFDNLKDNGFIE